MFVTLYTVTREYGGPEEGGWWYNDYQPVESVCIAGLDDDGAAIVKRMLKNRHAGLEYGDIYSVLGGCRIEAITEETKEEHATTERPHYS